MKTIKLKIKNEVDFTRELKLFNSVVRYSFNRFQEGLSLKEVRFKVKELFSSNSWFIECAIGKGKQIFEKHKDKKIVFGRKHLLKQYLKKLISKEEYCKQKLMPIWIVGEKLYKGNRLFNFNFQNSKLIFKLSRNNHQEIEVCLPRDKQLKELLKIQELVEQKQITVTVSFNNEYVWISFDESLLKLEEEFKDLKKNRIIGLDLNPNYIGLSVLEFDKNDNFKILYKQVFDFTKLNQKSGKSSSDSLTKYLKNKSKFEKIQICYDIINLLSYWKCSKLCIEDLNIKSSNKNQGKTFNRLCNNVWDKNLVVNKLKILSNIYNFELIKVNPAYSSFVGNLLYGNSSTPDMVASSIEIARRGYKKFEKGWFYPKFDVENLNEQWKQTEIGIKSWKELYSKIKESKLKYRFLLDPINAVFSKIHKQKLICIYTF